MLPPFGRLKGMTLDLLFPRWCVGCGEEGDFFCDSCRRSLPRIESPLCPRCGRPQSRETLCRDCASELTAIDGIRSPFWFDGAIRQAVHQLKYRDIRALAASLAQLLHEYLSTHDIPGEVLVPVPLHPRRLRERGYNQSGLLARELGRLSGMTVLSDCLVRLRQAPPQARTSTVEERRRNVTGMFSCRNDRSRGRQVLLIDDVATSGATLDACAAALKESGAASVWALALAREV